jgi:hypothetical protein
MSAVLKTLMRCKKDLQMTSPTTLWWITDSKNVARIFCRGSGDIALMRLALQVLELALELNLDLNTIWVSQSDPRLQKADTLTKQVNWDDWSVHPDTFNTLQQWFGVFSIDLFALPENFKVARYYSYSFSASSAGVNAFSLSWEGKNAYCAPPIERLAQVSINLNVLYFLLHGIYTHLQGFQPGNISA